MSPLTAALATTHEALYPRLDMLLRQVEAIAARKPEGDVPAETLATAEALLFDTRRFAGRGTGRDLAPAPDSFGALATVLGQALARLAAFETAHSVWSGPHNGFVWRLPRGELRPVARLRPHTALPVHAGDDRETARMRAEIVRRIAAKYDEGFDAGRKAAAASLSTPPSPGMSGG
ncbi:MAG: hypothetical protein ABI697_01475 [Devosia sp.]